MPAASFPKARGPAGMRTTQPRAGVIWARWQTALRTSAASSLRPRRCAMRRRLTYAEQQAGWFLAACAICGGCLGALWQALR